MTASDTDGEASARRDSTRRGEWAVLTLLVGGVGFALWQVIVPAAVLFLLMSVVLMVGTAVYGAVAWVLVRARRDRVRTQVLGELAAHGRISQARSGWPRRSRRAAVVAKLGLLAAIGWLLIAVATGADGPASTYLVVAPALAGTVSAGFLVVVTDLFWAFPIRVVSVEEAELSRDAGGAGSVRFARALASIAWGAAILAGPAAILVSFVAGWATTSS